MDRRQAFVVTAGCALTQCGLTTVARSDGPIPPVRDDAKAAMKRAAVFYRQEVATHGGYVYFYSPDLQLRFGEGLATPDQIWVQPPGTPTVGLAYLRAHEATGDSFYLQAATETAEALLYGQLSSGGWTNCIDFDPQGARVAQYRNGRSVGRNYSSLDDDQTQAAIRFLIRLDKAYDFQHGPIHEAVHFALDSLLAAQFTNGAFPQVWEGPIEAEHRIMQASYGADDWRAEQRIKNYWDLYTLNDGLAGSVARVLIDAHQTYGDRRYRSALEQLGRFLVLAQMPQPQPAWAQQYSYDMHPAWARAFEPPAIAGRESLDVLDTLLTIHEYTGDAYYLRPIPSAIEYLQRALLPDGRLARFYELRSNRPLYMQRQARVYTPTYDDSNLPDHYSWKTPSQLAQLEERFLAATREKSGHESAVIIAPGADRASSARRARVARIIAELDSRGRWISTFGGEILVGDQEFRRGEQYISSAVFSEHLTTLSEYVTSDR